MIVLFLRRYWQQLAILVVGFALGWWLKPCPRTSQLLASISSSRDSTLVVREHPVAVTVPPVTASVLRGKPLTKARRVELGLHEVNSVIDPFAIDTIVQDDTLHMEVMPGAKEVRDYHSHHAPVVTMVQDTLIQVHEKVLEKEVVSATTGWGMTARFAYEPFQNEFAAAVNPYLTWGHLDVGIMPEFDTKRQWGAYVTLALHVY